MFQRDGHALFHRTAANAQPGGDFRMAFAFYSMELEHLGSAGGHICQRPTNAVQLLPGNQYPFGVRCVILRHATINGCGGLNPMIFAQCALDSGASKIGGQIMGHAENIGLGIADWPRLKRPNFDPQILHEIFRLRRIARSCGQQAMEPGPDLLEDGG